VIQPLLEVQAVKDRRPLSVQVYDQLLTAMHDSGLVAGATIPGEIELSKQLGVSRTVLREALLLLEEDGILERGAGRRRSVASPARPPAGFTSPLETLVRTSHPLRVLQRNAAITPASSFARSLLRLGSDEEVACWETVFGGDGHAVCSALEFVSAERLTPQLRKLTEGDGPIDAVPTSLLGALGPRFRARSVPTLWRLSAARPHSGTPPWVTGSDASSLVALTVVLASDEKPLYLAKYLIRHDLASLVVASASFYVEPHEVDVAASFDQLRFEASTGGTDGSPNSFPRRSESEDGIAPQPENGWLAPEVADGSAR